MEARTLARTRAPIERVPVRVDVAHYDPVRDYQIGVQGVRRRGTGGRTEEVPLAAALLAAEAKGLALSTLLARERMRDARQVVADARAMALAPGDAVRIGDDPRVWRVVRSSVEAMRVTLDLVPLVTAPIERAADAGAVISSPDVQIGNTIVALFELFPTGDEAWPTPRLAIAAAGDQPGWRQARVEISRDDGVSWELAGGTAAPAIMGTVSAPVSRGCATLLDRASEIDVLLGHDGMVLQSAEPAQLMRGANVALLGDEVVQFARVRQVGPARWRLSQLRRGMNGSEATPHDPGTRFVLLEHESLLVPALAPRVGDRVRAVAYGVADADTRPGSATMTSGRSVAPLAPVHLRWTAQADGSARVSWIRRSRLGWRWDDGEVALGEEREAYRATVSGKLGSRMVMTTDPAVLVTAQEVAGGGVRVSVEQLGTVASSRAVFIMQGNQS